MPIAGAATLGAHSAQHCMASAATNGSSRVSSAAAAKVCADAIPLLPPRVPDDDRLLIVLDMDETLIHCVFGDDGGFSRYRSSQGAEPSFSTILPCEKRDKSTLLWFETEDRVEKPERVSVYKRPGLDAFIAELSRGIAAGEYEVVVFTNAKQFYADVVLDKIDLFHRDSPHYAAWAASSNQHLDVEKSNISRRVPITASVLHHRLYKDANSDGVKKLDRLGRNLGIVTHLCGCCSK